MSIAKLLTDYTACDDQDFDEIHRRYSQSAV